MSVTPFEIARHIERERRPWWIVWYGRHTGQYWAMAAWVPGPVGVLEAPTPDLLVAAMTNFELLHPKPSIDPSKSRPAPPPSGSQRQHLPHPGGWWDERGRRLTR